MKKGYSMGRAGRGFSRVERLVCVAGFAASLVASAHGQATRAWALPVTGTAGTAANWNPAGVPSALDDLYFNHNTAYTVTFGVNVPTSHWVWVQQGGVLFNFNSPHTNTYGFRVYGGAAAEFQAGSFTTCSISVPYTVNSQAPGSIEITGSGTTLTTGVGSGHPAYGPCEVNDNGTIIVSAGADLVSTRGSVGSSTTISPGANRPATLRVTGSGSTAVFSGELSLDMLDNTCTLEVLAGGSVTCGNLRFAGRDHTASVVTLSGSSTLNAGGAVVGANGASAIGTTTGISVGAGSSMILSGDFADNAGYSTSGAVDVSGTFEAAAFRSNGMDLHVTNSGVARLVADSGGDAVLRCQDVLVNGAGAGQTPSLVLNGAGFTSLNVEATTFVIGDDHAGSLDVRDGTFLFGGTIVRLGGSPGGSGSLLLRPAGQMRFTTPAGLRVGSGGVGTATINGALGTNRSGNINVGTGGIGTMDVTGTLNVHTLRVGSAGVDPAAVGGVTITGGSHSVLNMFVGGDWGGPTCNVALGGGASLVAMNDIADPDPASITINQAGVVGLTSSTLFANGGSSGTQLGVMLSGILDLSDGLVQGAVTMQSNPGADRPRISGSGEVNGRVDTVSGGLIQAATGQALVVGPAVSAGAFTNVGRMRSANGSTLRVRCSTATIQPGGTVELDNGTAVFTGPVVNNGDILGSGTFDADLSNNGFVSPLAGAVVNGITFTRGVTQAAGRFMQGSRIVFSPTSTFSGAGDLTADLLIDAGSVVDAGGTLNLGSVASPTGVDLRGTLRCNGNLVRLRDSNGALAGAGAVINLGSGGSLESAAGLTLQAGSLLRGSGTVTGSVSSLGSVSPAGTIAVTGNYVQNSAGTGGELVLDVAGTGAGQFDKLSVSGSATLGGRLTVTLAPSYTPQLGDAVTFLTAGVARVGTFSAITLNNNPAGTTWTLDYLPGSVRARVTAVGPACDSIDFNGDTLFPDTQDIADFIAVFGGAPCPTGTCGDIDFNNDGLFPDTDDISAFIRVFGGGACV
ncbi:MAG: hypothetical protein U0637_01330 [Phycisphaerales bacterium]